VFTTRPASRPIAQLTLLAAGDVAAAVWWAGRGGAEPPSPARPRDRHGRAGYGAPDSCLAYVLLVGAAPRSARECGANCPTSRPLQWTRSQRSAAPHGAVTDLEIIRACVRCCPPRRHPRSWPVPRARPARLVALVTPLVISVVAAGVARSFWPPPSRNLSLSAHEFKERFVGRDAGEVRQSLGKPDLAIPTPSTGPDDHAEGWNYKAVRFRGMMSAACRTVTGAVQRESVGVPGLVSRSALPGSLTSSERSMRCPCPPHNSPRADSRLP
jgi:hypothetical protein